MGSTGSWAKYFEKPKRIGFGQLGLSPIQFFYFSSFSSFLPTPIILLLAPKHLFLPNWPLVSSLTSAPYFDRIDFNFSLSFATRSFLLSLIFLWFFLQLLLSFFSNLPSSFIGAPIDSLTFSSWTRDISFFCCSSLFLLSLFFSSSSCRLLSSLFLFHLAGLSINKERMLEGATRWLWGHGGLVTAQAWLTARQSWKHGLWVVAAGQMRRRGLGRRRCILEALLGRELDFAGVSGGKG